MKKFRSKRAVLFDLGNTLAKYYQLADFPPILADASGRVHELLCCRGLARPEDIVTLQDRVGKEDFESKDLSVRPLADRLKNIFQLSDGTDLSQMDMIRFEFMRPILALGTVYDDSIPILRELRETKFLTAIVTNSPWGSEPDIWRLEVRRLGLLDETDALICCGDVGWRKPARQIFEHAVQSLGVEPHECLFVGDDPRWDVVGPASIGMDAVLIDRMKQTKSHPDAVVIHELSELMSLIDKNQT